MKKVIICIGLPGSGKSTWAKNYLEANSNILRLNRDSLRIMLGGKWTAKYEEIVKESELKILQLLLQSSENYTIIIDDTNLNLSTINSILKICHHLNVLDIELKSFLDVSLLECIERDSKRDKPVGEKLIFEMSKKIPEIKKVLHL